MWSLACLDWQDRIKSGRSLVPDLPLLNLREADRALKTFNALRLPDVPGTPTLGEACGDWFRDIVRALFGSYDPATKARAIREFFALVPKKNAKTSYGAALMVTALIVNRRPRGEFMLVAPTQPVTALAFGQALGMIELDPYLRDRFHVQEHLKKITDRQSKAKLEIKSFDPAIVTGTRGAGILLDEIHVVASQADADRVVGQLRGGLVSQSEGFLGIITTQSERPPSGVFAAELRKARAIRDGRIAGRMLPVLYEFPPGVDWRDPANWWMVTPNRDRSITVARLIEDEAAAREAGEAEHRRWASQHLNVEIGLALAFDAWAGAAHWMKNAEPGLTLDDLLERCEVLVVGIDGGGLDDLLGLAVIGREREPPQLPSGCRKIIERLAGQLPDFPAPEAKPAKPESRRWLHWAHAWCHVSVLELRKDIAERLRDFVQDGDLTIVDRVGDDVIGVADVVERIRDAGLLPEKKAIGVDPAGIGEILEELGRRGVDVTPEAAIVIGIPQGWKLTGSIKTTERKLAGGDLRHCGSRLMAWSVGNAKVVPAGNAISITKQASGTAKIDPLMATFDASALMQMHPDVGGIGEGIIILESA